MKTKAIALLRSAMKSKQAIKMQRQCIESYSEKHNIKILKFYTENGVSGFSMKENRLTSIFSDINKNLDCPSVLLVSSISRISRNLNYLLDATAAFENNGIKIISVEEEKQAECDDSFSRTLPQTFAKLINESINRQRSKHIKAKQTELARDGYFPCGYIPFGYSLENSKRKSSHILRKKLVIHKEESQVVKKIFELASLKIPLNKNKALKISTELNENNIHCRGKRWTANKIINFLSNSTYLGEYVWGKNRDYNCKDNPPIKINVPAIITQDLFMQVNKVLAKTKTIRGIKR
jgi:DNA invertase Pin-like site-specific DNA recombinase